MTTEQYPAWVPCVNSRKFPVGLKPTILFHCAGRETHWAVCWVGQDKFWGQASRKTIKGPETGSPRVSAPSYIETDHETSTPSRQSGNRTSPYLTPDHMRRPLITSSLQQELLWYLQPKHLTSCDLQIHSDTTMQGFTSSEQKPMLDPRYWPEFQRRQLFNLGQLDIAQIALWNDI